MDDKQRLKTILDDGIYSRQKVRINVGGIYGEVTGADFEANTVQIEVNVPAHLVEAIPSDQPGQESSP